MSFLMLLNYYYEPFSSSCVLTSYTCMILYVLAKFHEFIQVILTYIFVINQRHFFVLSLSPSIKLQANFTIPFKRYKTVHKRRLIQVELKHVSCQRTNSKFTCTSCRPIYNRRYYMYTTFSVIES